MLHILDNYCMATQPLSVNTLMDTVHDYYAFTCSKIRYVSSVNYGESLHFCTNPHPVQAFQTDSALKLSCSLYFAFLPAADVSTTCLSKRNPF